MLSPPDGAPLILAAGSFAADRHLLREDVTENADDVLLRTAPGSTGDARLVGLDAGPHRHGAGRGYARAIPPPRADRARRLRAAGGAVRDDLGAPLGWDLAFLAFGAALVVAGTGLTRTAVGAAGARGARPGRARAAAR
jgi:hypothetical protein